MTRKALSVPLVAAPPGAVSIRTRLFVSARDEAVLTEVGEHLGSLLRGDLAARCRLGAGSKHLGRAERKKRLTPLSSSRWAGSITRTVDDMWERGYKNLEDLAVRDRREISEIERRSALAVGRDEERKRGYASGFERHQKMGRLQRLQARLAATEVRLEDARVSVVVGGERLLRNRHHLEDVGLTEGEWREKWDAKRMFLRADGEAGKRWGNETIRVMPDADGDYRVAIRLPTPLSHLSNTLGRATAYLLNQPIEWHNLHDEWRTQASRHRAVSYRIHRDPERERWYITASWSIEAPDRPSVEEVNRSGRCLAIDVNAGSLDGRILDIYGNPVGRPVKVSISQEGNSARRLGRLREAVSQLLKWAVTQGVTVIAVERLDFSDARALGRQRGRRGAPGRSFRRKVCGIPTAKFGLTLSSAARRHRLTVIAVDPAYTSKWGQRYWKKPLDRSRRQSGDRHQAAAVVIGRRSQGYDEKRKNGQNPRRPEDRRGRAPSQRIAPIPGMAPAAGNDGYERPPPVSAVTIRADTRRAGRHRRSTPFGTPP